MRRVATMTSKGQVTIPVDIRRHLGLCKSDKVEFVVGKNGDVKIQRAQFQSILDLAGSIPALPGRETIDFEDFIKEAQDEAVDRWLGLE